MNTKTKNWMTDFQSGYTHQDFIEVSHLIEKLYNFDDDTVIIGTKINEWLSDQSGVENMTINHFNDYASVDFKFSEARVYETEGDVFICALGELTSEIPKPDLFDSLIKTSLEVLNSDQETIQKTQHIGRMIATGLVDAEMGTTSVHPFRFNVVLKEIEGIMKAHHMQFSFDAEFLWQHRYLDEKSLQPHFEMDRREDHQDIRNLLHKFQEGYNKRDVSIIDDYLDLFTGDDQMITIGTDAEEFFEGKEELKEIIESDWTYWGDFKINVEGAVIVADETSAYFSTKAMLHKTHSIEVMKESSVSLMQSKLEDETLSTEMKLLSTLKMLLAFNHEIAQGEHYYSPMRFTGYLLKRNNEWRFQHIQYSDNIIQPEKRL